jgi:flagellin-like hook-associated protein FlgL
MNTVHRSNAGLDGVSGRDLYVQPAAVAGAVAGIRAEVLAAANTRGPDGTYVLSGSQSAVPFTAAGAYVGDSVSQQIETGEGLRTTVSVTGTVLTAANGVDVLGVLDGLTAALQSNAVPGVQQAIGDLNTAIGQVSQARGAAGQDMTALDSAETARQGLEQRLAEIHSRTVETDPIAGAAALQRAQQALDVAKTVSSTIVAMTKLQ